MRHCKKCKYYISTYDASPIRSSSPSDRQSRCFLLGKWIRNLNRFVVPMAITADFQLHRPSCAHSGRQQGVRLQTISLRAAVDLENEQWNRHTFISDTPVFGFDANYNMYVIWNRTVEFVKITLSSSVWYKQPSSRSERTPMCRMMLLNTPAQSAYTCTKFVACTAIISGTDLFKATADWAEA